MNTSLYLAVREGEAQAPPIADRLHRVSEPLIVDGRIFYRCSCGHVWEGLTGSWSDALCAIEAIGVDYAFDVKRAQIDRDKRLAHRTVVGQTAAAELHRLRAGR